MHTLKKIGKAFLYIVFGIMALLLIVSLFIDPIAKRVLEYQVSNAAEGQYALELEDVDIALYAGNFRLEGILLKTDTTQAKEVPVVFAEINEMAAEGVSWLTFLLDQELLVDRIYLDSMDLEVKAHSIQQETDTTQPPFRLDQLDIYQQIEDKVDRIHLEDLGLYQISLELINLSTQDTLQFVADKLDLRSDDIVVDANKVFTDSRAFYSTRIDLDGKNLLVRRLGNKRMVGQANVLEFDTREDKLGIQAQGVNFLQSGKSYEDTLIFAALQEFELRELDLQRVQEENAGHIEKIALRELDLINYNPTQPDTTISTDTAQSSNLTQLSLGEKLPALMDSLILEELVIHRVDYRQGDMMRLEGADLSAQQIVVNEKTAFANNRFLYANTLKSSFGSLVLSMGMSKLALTMKDFAMNIEEGVGSLGFQQLQAASVEKQEDSTWFEAEIGPLQVFSLNTRQLPEKRLVIDSIAIQDPEVLMHMPPSSSAQSSGRKQSTPALNLYPAIEGRLESLFLRKLAVIGGDIRLTGMGDSSYGAHIPAVYLQLRDILIAEGTSFADERVLHAEDIALRMENIQYLMPDNVYMMRLGLFRMSTFEQFLEASNLRYGFKENYEQLLNGPQSNTIYQLENQKLLVTGLNYQQLLQQKGFFAKTLRSEGLDFYLYTDPDKPSEEQQKQPLAMPQKMLKQVNKPFYLGTLAVEDAHITYEENVAEADTSGLVEITDLTVLANNITNVQSILREKSRIPLEVEGMLMGSGAFTSQMVVHMLSDTNLVTFSGRLDTLEVTKLNRLVQNTSRLAFESGTIYTVNWDMKIDQEKAVGTLAMSYDNLDIQLSEKDSPDTTGILKNVGSFLVNNLVLESDVSPQSSDKPKTVSFSEEREEKGFPNYVLQAMVTGFLEIMVTVF